jgi:hypothetical protein
MHDQVTIPHIVTTRAPDAHGDLGITRVADVHCDLVTTRATDVHHAKVTTRGADVHCDNDNDDGDSRSAEGAIRLPLRPQCMRVCVVRFVASATSLHQSASEWE